MGTTALSSLKTGFAIHIGDSNGDYSGNYENAFSIATREVKDDLFIPLDNQDLITGNILPVFNWATSSTLDFYTEPTGTLAKNTDGAYIWNGENNAKLTASGASDKLYLDSDNYPRLLDIMGKTVDLKGWVYPEVASDAILTIYTLTKGSVAQTLASTTTTYALKKCLVELEGQAISDDIQKVQVWLAVTTTLKYSYFDMPRLIANGVREYLLPKDFQDGRLSSVEIQTSGHADDACDDLHPTTWESVYGWDIILDGVYKYLRLPAGYSNERRIRLKGYKPLEQLNDATDTVSIDGGQVKLLLSYAAGILFQIESQELQYVIDGYTDAITAVDVEIDTPAGSIDTLKTSIATATTALDAITTDIATANNGINNVAASIATTQLVIDTAVTAVATVASEDISRYEATIARNQAQIDRKVAIRDQETAKRDYLLVKRDAKDADIKRLDDQRQRLDDEITRFEAERNRINQKRTESKDVMNKLKLRSLEWFGEYYRLLPSLRMTLPKVTMNVKW